MVGFWADAYCMGVLWFYSCYAVGDSTELSAGYDDGADGCGECSDEYSWRGLDELSYGRAELVRMSL